VKSSAAHADNADMHPNNAAGAAAVASFDAGDADAVEHARERVEAFAAEVRVGDLGLQGLESHEACSNL